MQQPQQTKKRSVYWQNIYQFSWVIAALWVVEVVDTLFFGSKLEYAGTRPGNWNHWEGIFLAPLLHDDVEHLSSNSLGLLIFGVLILIRGWKPLIAASLYPVVIGGLFVMLIGDRDSVHIGASGIVYGYWTYILTVSFYDRTLLSVAIAVVVILLYGGYIYGMIPSQYNEINRISWEGHLGGALGGFMAAGRKNSLYTFR